VLWDASGSGFPVEDSGVTGPDTVWLVLPSEPGTGPYRLALNPWVAALAAGQQPPGDGDAGTAAWDRAFVDAGGNPAGSASVVATPSVANPGQYELLSTGLLANGRRAVSVVLTRAGLPEQRLGDWKVEDEP